VIEALQKAVVKSSAAAPEALKPLPPAAPPAPAAPPPSKKAMPPQPASSKRGGPPDEQDHPYAPALSLVDLSGQKVSLSDLKGQVVALNFWATWCPRCRAALPHLMDLQDKYRAQGLRVIGLSIDESPKAVRKYFEMQRVNYPVAMADFKTRRDFGGISGVPTTVLIGRDGRIYFTRVGVPEGAGISHYLESEIKMLLDLPAGGTPSPVADSDSDLQASSVTPGGADQPDTTGPPAKASVPAGTPKAKLPPLADPSPAEIQNIIQEFAAKEKVFKEARATYTYHQLNKVSEYDSEGNPGGKFEQEWDILFEDSGKRIERVTYAPPDTLRMIGMTKEDLESFRSIQPFVLTSDELGEYDVKYLGHVRVDEITAYVFDVRPKELKKGRVYFQGRIWVDDRDLQIVKSEGKTVPQVTEGKQQNLFPRFTTYREQIDGKFWFPTYTLADDTLYFSQGPVKVKQVIRYTDYKQFKSRVRILSTEEVGAPETPTPPPSEPATKAPTKKKQ
jgi:thiol-disulfide isomerase/thioredoxin